MEKTKLKKFALWTALSIISGSLVGGLLPLLLQSEWPHQLAVKVVLAIMSHKV